MAKEIKNFSFLDYAELNGYTVNRVPDTDISFLVKHDEQNIPIEQINVNPIPINDYIVSSELVRVTITAKEKDVIELVHNMQKEIKILSKSDNICLVLYEVENAYYSIHTATTVPMIAEYFIYHDKLISYTQKRTDYLKNMLVYYKQLFDDKTFKIP